MVAWIFWEVMTRPKCMGGLGFQDLELFNMALLARQAWRIIQEPTSLSAKLLKAVYFPDSCLLDATMGSHPSQIWRYIEGSDVLAQGLIRRIWDGATTEIWWHNWLQRDGSKRPITTPLNASVSLVKDLNDETSGSWREELIQNTFFPIDASAILGILLCT